MNRILPTDFKKAVGRNPSITTPFKRFVESTGIQNFLKQFTALEVLPAHVLRSLVAELEEVSSPRRSEVVKEGEIGELALLTGSPRSASVVARTDCELYAMGKGGFDRALAASPEFRLRLEEKAELYRSQGARRGVTPIEEMTPEEEPSEEAMRRVAKEDGIVLDPGLVRRLLDFEILVPDRGP